MQHDTLQQCARRRYANTKEGIKNRRTGDYIRTSGHAYQIQKTPLSPAKLAWLVSYDGLIPQYVRFIDKNKAPTTDNLIGLSVSGAHMLPPKKSNIRKTTHGFFRVKLHRGDNKPPYINYFKSKKKAWKVAQKQHAKRMAARTIKPLNDPIVTPLNKLVPPKTNDTCKKVHARKYMQERKAHKKQLKQLNHPWATTKNIKLMPSGDLHVTLPTGKQKVCMDYNHITEILNAL